MKFDCCWYCFLLWRWVRKYNFPASCFPFSTTNAFLFSVHLTRQQQYRWLSISGIVSGNWNHPTVWPSQQKKRRLCMRTETVFALPELTRVNQNITKSWIMSSYGFWVRHSAQSYVIFDILYDNYVCAHANKGCLLKKIQ